MRGLFGTLAHRASQFKSTDISALTWTELLGGPNTRSGVTVSVDSALRVTTALACARVLAEGIAQLPLKIYRVDSKKGTKTPAIDDPVYKLLARRPNDWQTSFEFREMLMFHAVFTGNGYAYIGRGGRPSRIVELIPLVPAQVTVAQDVQYGLTYSVADKAGHVATFPRSDILHIRGPAWNGYLGLDIIQLIREAIGLAIVTEEAHSNLHANGAKPGGVLSIKGKLDADRKTRLKESFQQNAGGIRNAYKTLVVDMDSTWTQMAMTGVDNQHIETRKLQIEEICRGMRVFPQMVGHSDKTSTFASAESFFLAHVTHSLMPWTTRWEHAIERDLLGEADDLVAKFNYAALLRGDNLSRASFYEKALGGSRAETAYMTRNEVRALEELDPIEGGDVLPTPVAPAASAPSNTPPGGSDPSAEDLTEAARRLVLETKRGRVLSAANESKIAKARDHLNDVLDTITVDPAPEPTAP